MKSPRVSKNLLTNRAWDLYKVCSFWEQSWTVSTEMAKDWRPKSTPEAHPVSYCLCPLPIHPKECFKTVVWDPHKTIIHQRQVCIFPYKTASKYQPWTGDSVWHKGLSCFSFNLQNSGFSLFWSCVGYTLFLYNHTFGLKGWQEKLRKTTHSPSLFAFPTSRASKSGILSLSWFCPRQNNHWINFIPKSLYLASTATTLKVEQSVLLPLAKEHLHLEGDL